MSSGLSDCMCVRMWETLGSVCIVSRREVMADGVRVGLRARRRSGLSRMRRVLRCAEAEEREDMAVVSVVWRCARSRDLSV